MVAGNENSTGITQSWAVVVSALSLLLNIIHGITKIAMIHANPISNKASGLNPSADGVNVDVPVAAMSLLK